MPTTTTAGAILGSTNLFDPDYYRIKCKYHYRGLLGKNPMLAPAHHFSFVTWFEQICPVEKRKKYMNEYVFALRGIGLSPSDQKNRLKFMEIFDWKENWVRRKPSKNFYPDVLPLYMFEVLRLLHDLYDESKEIKKWENLIRRARILALFWQSRNIDRMHGKPSGEFPISYLTLWAGAGRNTINNDVAFLEKFKFIKCVQKGFGFGNQCRSNRYLLHHAVLKYTYPLIYIPKHTHSNLSNYGGINSVSEDGYICSNLAIKLFDPVVYEFDTNNRTRRKQSADTHRYHNHSDSVPVENKLWCIMSGSKKIIEQKNELQREAIPKLKIDQKILREDLGQYESQLLIEEDESIRRKLNREILICKQLLNQGLDTNFNFTDTGRNRLNSLANHLNTSREWQKVGYSLFRTLRSNSLFDSDIKNAEIYTASIVTKDKQLFDDLNEAQDFYLMVANQVVPEEAEYLRHSIKQIVLMIQYGAGKKAILKEFKHPIYLELYRLVSEYLEANYPVYFGMLKRIKDIGRRIIMDDKFPLLPNEFPLKIGGRNSYALLSHINQAYISIVTAELYLWLNQLGYEPVFDMHDAVVTQEEPTDEIVNAIVRNSFQGIIDSLKLDWRIPSDQKLAKVNGLIFDNLTNMFDSNDNKKVNEAEMFTQLLLVAEFNPKET
jgi:hypothetical protein